MFEKLELFRVVFLMIRTFWYFPVFKKLDIGPSLEYKSILYLKLSLFPLKIECLLITAYLKKKYAPSTYKQKWS